MLVQPVWGEIHFWRIGLQILGAHSVEALGEEVAVLIFVDSIEVLLALFDWRAAKAAVVIEGGVVGAGGYSIHRGTVVRGAATARRIGPAEDGSRH
jgi:hypothetical protein